MRLTVVLLVSLLTIACGMGSSDPHSPKMTNFSPPSITELTPNSVPVNSVPFALTINGTNFSTDAIVFWNGMPLSTTFVTSQQLVASLQATDLMTFGMIPVFVRTGGLNSNTVDFDMTAQ